MKFILLAVTLFTFGAFSQNNCANEVSTNPLDPYNNSLPTTLPVGGSQTTDDSKFINSYDWSATANLQLQNMQSNQNMLYLHNASAPYYSYIYNGAEMTPENGWELMLYNVGTYPDLSDNPNGESSDIPYIAIYNKFTGILRIFAVYGNGYIPDGVSFDGVLINVAFDEVGEEVNGILRLPPGGDVALDKPTSTFHIQSSAFHTNSPKKWFSADIQLTYDPCICYYPSHLRISFDFLNKLDLTLYGRSITTSDDIADGNSLLTNKFLSNFQFDGSNSDDQIILYKVMEDFVDDYLEKMTQYKQDLAAIQEYNKQVERNLFIINLFKGVVIQGATFAVSSFIGQAWYANGAEFTDELVPADGADSATVKKYTEKLSSFASKIFGQSTDSFIKKNFEKKSNPNKPEAPMASFTELRMQGSIVDTLTIYGSRFFTPGSYGSEGTGNEIIVNPLEYPIYNNAVGHFALLNTPKIKGYKSEGQIVDEYYSSEYNRGYASWRHNYQFELAEDLYYAINDIGVESHEITIAVEFIGETDIYGSNTAGTFIDPEYTINLFSDKVETNEYYPLYSNNAYGFNHGKNYCFNYPDTNTVLPVCTYETLSIQQTKEYIDTISFYSEYMPLDVISPMTFSVGIMNQVGYNLSYEYHPDPNSDGNGINNFKARVRIKADVVFSQLDENGDNVTGSFMFAYDTDSIEWVSTPLETDLPNSAINYSNFKPNLVLTTTDFDGSPIDGCKLVGTHYTCHGWDDVTVVGDLTTSNGHTVDIFGANNVFVIGESNVSPEIVLDIQTLLDYSEPMPRADGPFVEKFCKNALDDGFPDYSANIPNKADLEEYEAFNTPKPNNPSSFDLLSINLYPVPSSNVLNLRSSVSLSNEEIVIVDFSGRVLDLPIRKISDRDFEIIVSELAVGSYYLTISSNEGQAKKLFTVAKTN